MQNDKFDDLYEKILKAKDLADQVPSEMKNEVFRALFEVAKQSNDASDFYKEELSKLTQNGEALKDFLTRNKPTSNLERSLLFVYYLENLGLKSISANHISQCYELAELSMPGNLIQNLRDACSSRYGYLESVQNCFRTTERGREFCTSPV